MTQFFAQTKRKKLRLFKGTSNHQVYLCNIHTQTRTAPKKNPLQMMRETKKFHKQRSSVMAKKKNEIKHENDAF